MMSRHWVARQGLARLGCLALLAAGLGRSDAGAEVVEGVAERVARVFSPELRQADSRLGEIGEELTGLPELRDTPLANRYGYRSDTLLDQSKPHWVQLDLGRARAIDCVVALPAHIPDLGELGEGYGFPLRFKIEVADNPEMLGAVTVVDRSGEDVVNPGRFPMIFHIDPVQGRHLRFTSARHVPVEGGFMWALEELVVLAGNKVLNGNKVVGYETVASGSLELYPHWSLQRLDDSQSALGLPVNTEASPSQGYLSAATEDPQEEKWLEVDLGEAYPIDEVRLVTAESEEFEVVGGRGNPKLMTVELSNDPDFSGQLWQARAGGGDLLGFPGGCADILQVYGHRARYLRIVAEELWSREGRYAFALAEVQVYSGGENVALGKVVAAKDVTDKPASAGWAPEFVVDGFSSRHRLIEYPEYLDLIGRRGQLERERASLLELRERKVRSTGLVLGYGGASLGAIAALGFGWVLVRQRTLRRRAVAQLRDQIARDLHDDIGSNLGGIVLLSEIGSRHSEDDQARQDFATIREAADKTSQSMQDIVWLIGSRNTGLRDLVSRMRQAGGEILGEGALSLAVEPAEFRDRRVSLFFRRHLFFAFKEALNNVRKHASAKAVEARLTIDANHLTFEVIDDGVGFDPTQPARDGHGLKNLQQRAERLGGTCRVASARGDGARVTFKAPLNSRSK